MKPVLAGVLLVLMLIIRPGAAMIDGMELAMRQPYQDQLPMIWQSTSSLSPDVSQSSWSFNQLFDSLAFWRNKTIRLQTDHKHRFYLPAYENLRLYDPHHQLTGDMVEAYLSNGTGLLKKTVVTVSKDGHSVLISPQIAYPVYVDVKLNNSYWQFQDYDFEVLVSKTRSTNPLAPYPTLKSLSGEQVWLYDSGLNIPQLFSVLKPYRQTLVTVQGPLRIRLKHRIHYEAQTAALNQAYRISYRIDQLPEEWLDLSTSVEKNVPIYIDSQMQTVSRSESAYIDIPSGSHQLELVTDQTVYFQILEQSDDDYLLPLLNEPALSVKTVREHNLIADQALINSNELAKTLVRDNRFQNAPLSGQYVMKQAALQRSDYPLGLRKAQQLSAAHTFFRTLLPVFKHSRQAFRTLYFRHKRLTDLDSDIPPQEEAQILAGQHFSAALNQLGYARFSPISDSKTGKDIYVLPQRSVPAIVRLIVDRSQCHDSTIYVESDQLGAQEFKTECSDFNHGTDTFRNTLADTALQQMQADLQTDRVATLTHEFAQYRKPGDLIPVAVFELTVPVSLTHLNIWAEQTNDSNNQQPLYLAVQIQQSSRYQLAEQGYLSQLNELQGSQSLQLLVADLTSNAELTSSSQQQLLNQWIPLKRYLLKLYREFKSSVAGKYPVRKAAESDMLNNLLQQVEKTEQQQQWIDALQLWSQVIETSQGHMREQALLSQADLLERLSENYLAESILRYLVLYAQPDIAEQARQRLLNRYQANQQTASIIRLAATSFFQHPDQSSLEFLVNSLVTEGKDRYVLLLGLNAETGKATQAMLTAAYRLDWWQTFTALVNRLPESQQGLWQGLMALKQGDVNRAETIWKGEQGSAWFSYLQHGKQLREKLSSFTQQLTIDDQTLIGLYRQWMQWQQSHPGASQWVNAGELIKDAEGALLFHSIERDELFSEMKSTPLRPVKLSVLGPARLKLQMRILHPQAQQVPENRLDAWLQIKDNGTLSEYLLTNSQPVPGLVNVYQPEMAPGSVQSFEYQVGEGMHEIAVSSKFVAMTVAVKQERPELPMGIVAPLNATVFAEHFKRSGFNEKRLAKLIPVTESQSAAVPTQGESLKTLLALPQPDKAAEAGQHMMRYLNRIEQDKDSRQALLTIAEAIYRQYQDDSTVRSMWNRISRYSTWQTVYSVNSHAGVQFVRVDGWKPASRNLQIRQAMLADNESDQHVLSGYQRLVMAMSNLEPRQIQVEAKLDDLRFLPDHRTEVLFQVDDQPMMQIQLSRLQGWKQFALDIPAGEHEVRFSIANPVTNQFVKLRFAYPELNIQLSRERTFFVSRHDAPLQVNVKGPTTLKIDEWHEQKLITRYQTVEPGWQHITITPSINQNQSLVQVRQRIANELIKPVKPRIITRRIKPASGYEVQPVVVTSADNSVYQTRLESSLDAIQSNTGTWSLATDLIRRNNVQEDAGLSGPIHFQQLRLEHRYFDLDNQAYWNTELFTRYRENGKPSFGITESIRWQPRDFPFSINLDARLMTQEVDSRQEWMGQLKAGLYKRFQFTPKTSFTPGLSWYGRYLSLRNSNRVLGDDSFRDKRLVRKVDQDLYTIYKAQHTTGLIASLTFNHQPWLDTSLTARVSSVSNENMNVFIPDHMSTEVHWKQLLGDFDLDASMRVNFYQEDNQRSRDIRRHFTRLRLNWQNWTARLNRFELNAEYNYDIDRDEHLGMLSVTYHFGDYRGLRDFKPGAVNFRRIRELQSLDGYR